MYSFGCSWSCEGIFRHFEIISEYQNTEKSDEVIIVIDIGVKSKQIVKERKQKSPPVMICGEGDLMLCL